MWLGRRRHGAGCVRRAISGRACDRAHRLPAGDKSSRSSGQMAVEFAVTMPIIAMVAFIALNGLIFAGDCVAFDIAARDAVRLQADDGSEADCAAEVRTRIEERLGMSHESVEVACETVGLGHLQYTATASFAPPFLSGASIFGVSVPQLRHEVSFTVSPYRKGVVV